MGRNRLVACAAFALVIFICFLFLELFSGYLLFQRKRGGIAALELVFGATPPPIPIKVQGNQAILDLKEWPNLFASYPSTVGYYRFHPFIDYSGVHIKSKDGSITSPQLDYFGFRNKDSSIYFERPKGILVVMTGGSEVAGYSHDRPIPELLQEKLISKLGQPVTVLNLAMNSYVLANEINSYVHLAAKLHPDLVISHSGWTDMIFGALAPPPFKRLGLNYFAQIASWLPRLYDLRDGPALKREVVLEGLSDLPAAYFSNVKLYRRLVEGNGGQFIAGLQGYNKTSTPNDLHQTVHGLMDKLQEGAREAGMLDLTNMKLTFSDAVHSDSASAETIAEAYAQAALESLKSRHE